MAFLHLWGEETPQPSGQSKDNAQAKDIMDNQSRVDPILKLDSSRK